MTNTESQGEHQKEAYTTTGHYMEMTWATAEPIIYIKQRTEV